MSEIHEKRIDSTFSTNFYEANNPKPASDQNSVKPEYEDYLPEEYPEQYPENYPEPENDYPIGNYDLPSEEAIKKQPQDIDQTPYIRQQGAYYRGRLGLPNPVFNVHTRRIQPGPRFRNEMVKPKHFRGKKNGFFLVISDSDSVFIGELQ